MTYIHKPNPLDKRLPRNEVIYDLSVSGLVRVLTTDLAPLSLAGL